MPKSDIDSRELYDKYIELGSLQKTGQHFGISRGKISKILKNDGFGILPKQKKYSCDDGFFSRDNPESFYWAGFLAADGCVYNSKGNTQIKVNLAIKDRRHLEKFADAVRFTGRIEDVKWKNKSGVLVRITSKKMAEDLVRFNIVPQKTFIYTFPEWIKTHNLLNHYMRGYFDGDGSCWTSKPSISSGGITPNTTSFIIGTESFVRSYSEIIKNVTNTNAKIRKKGNVYQHRVCGNIANLKIAHFLYHNSDTDTRLERKYKVFYSKGKE